MRTRATWKTHGSAQGATAAIARGANSDDGHATPRRSDGMRKARIGRAIQQLQPTANATSAPNVATAASYTLCVSVGNAE